MPLSGYSFVNMLAHRKQAVTFVNDLELWRLGHF